MSGQVLVCCPECGSTNIVRHISGEFECLSCGYKWWGEGRRYGHPRTEEERRERHKERYGTEELPPRGTARDKEEALRQYRSKLLDTVNLLSKLKDTYGSLQVMADTLGFEYDKSEFRRLYEEAFRQSIDVEKILSTHSREK